MKSGKRHLTDGMELPNQDKIRTLAENEIYKYLGILEADTIKQEEMKNKIQKQYLRRTRKLVETKLSRRNLIKGINTWAVPLVDIPDPFWSRPEMNLNKWTKEQENLWPCIRLYIPETTLTDYMHQEKREEEDLPTLRTTLTLRYDSKTTYKNTMEDWLHPSETILITRWTTEWQ